VIAAVSVSGPSFRLAPDSFDAVAAQVVAAVSDLNRRLGFFDR
jgi:DNA-binding IclR family transcriptional regulator